MEAQVKMRLGWVKHYQHTGNVSLTSRRCGVSRPTLSKWLKRYQQLGIDGLLNRSRRPHHCRANKVTADDRGWIGQLRQRRLGPRRIQGELEVQLKQAGNVQFWWGQDIGVIWEAYLGQSIQDQRDFEVLMNQLWSISETFLISQGLKRIYTLKHQPKIDPQWYLGLLERRGYWKVATLPCPICRVISSGLAVRFGTISFVDLP